MSRTRLIGGITLVALIAAYAGTSWYCAKKLEQQGALLQAQFEKFPFLKLTQTQRKMGFFSTDIDYSITVTPAENVLPKKQMESLNTLSKLDLHQHIVFGPFPGLFKGDFSLQRARIETKFVLSEKDKAEMLKALGGKEIFSSAITNVAFNGDNVTKIEIGGFTLSDPKAKVGKMTFGGAHSEFSANANFDTLEASSTLDGLWMEGEVHAQIEHLSNTVKAKKIAEFDDLWTFEGESKIGRYVIKTAAMPINFDMHDFSLKAFITRNGNFVDIGGEYGVGGFDYNDIKLGKAKYALSARHLNGPAFGRIVNVMLAEMKKGKPSGDSFTRVQPDFLTIMKNTPELRIDEISLTQPTGDMATNVSIKIDGYDAADQANPFGLLAKLDVNGKAHVHLPTLFDLFDKVSKSGAAGGMPMDSMKAKINATVDKWAETKLVVREGNTISTVFGYKNSRITLNGNSYTPAELAALATPAPDETTASSPELAP